MIPFTILEKYDGYYVTTEKVFGTNYTTLVLISSKWWRLNKKIRIPYIKKERYGYTCYTANPYFTDLVKEVDLYYK